MKKYILLGLLIVVLVLIASPVIGAVTAEKVVQEPIATEAVAIEAPDVVGVEAPDVVGIEAPITAEPIQSDPCGGRRCALYCEYGSVPGSCGCQCLPAPQDKIENLPAVIETLGLPQGFENNLVSTINNAIKSLEKGNKDAAINQLQAFINKVEAQRGKKISEQDAEMLIAYANKVIAKIEAGEKAEVKLTEATKATAEI